MRPSRSQEAELLPRRVRSASFFSKNHQAAFTFPSNKKSHEDFPHACEIKPSWLKAKTR
jgi:hypothetical protein